MRKLSLVAISLAAVFAQPVFAVAKVGGVPGVDPNAGVYAKIDKNMAYWTKQLYQPDADAGSSLVDVQKSISAQQNAPMAQHVISESSNAFNQQVLNANSYQMVKDKDGKPQQQFAVSTTSPSDNLQAYSALPDSSPLAAAADYSYMNLVNGETDFGSQYDTTVTTDLNTCLYGLAGTVKGSKSDSSVLASALPGITTVQCQYNSKLTQAINYIHMLAGYNSKISDSYSGNQAQLKKMSADDMQKYKSVVRNAVTARSAGEDALYDVMQGHISVNGQPSVDAVNQQRYNSRADSLAWHEHVETDSVSTVLRQQAVMLADIEKELGTLIQLQKKQYALSAINEMQMSNLVLQSKIQGVTGQMQASSAKQQQEDDLKNNNKGK